MGQDLDKFAEELELLGEKLGSDLTGPLQKCKPIILEGIQQNFNQSKSSTGFRWPPRKDKKKHPLLILTEELKAAATGGEGSINRMADATTLDIGVDASSGKSGRPWAEIHQEGGTKIPARPFLGFSDAVLDECEDVLVEYAMSEFLG